MSLPPSFLAAVFFVGFAAALLLLALVDKYYLLIKRIDEVLYVVRWLSRYEKELTLIALREQRKGERRNANKTP